ncbi:MAG: DUF1987 domain-containing protein [Bacteroidota bacterium]
MAESSFPEPLYIEGSDSTPEVKLNKQEGELEFIGKSLPENVKEFYSSILHWIKKYLEDPNEKTKVIFNFEYFNTASSKVIMDIIEKLKILQDNGSQIEINWYYIEEDDDMLEAGEDYSDITEIPFNFISYQ